MKKEYIAMIGVAVLLALVPTLGGFINSPKKEISEQIFSRQKICENIISEAWEENDAAIDLSKEISKKSPKLYRYVQFIHSKFYEQNLNKAISNHCGDFQYSHKYGESK
jgi:hypothetical protein